METTRRNRVLGGILAVFALAALGAGCDVSVNEPAMAEDDPEASGDLDELYGGKYDQTLPGKEILLVALNDVESNSPSDFESDDHCFLDNARELAKWYAGYGAGTTVLSANTAPSMVERLEYWKTLDVQFDRIILIGHGTGNGPLFCCGYSPQPGWDYPNQSDKAGDENLRYFEDLGKALGDVTSPDGWIYVGACNPGQETDLPGFDNYLEALACVSGRDTLGTNTKTACWDVTRRIKRLEGPEQQTTLGLIRQNACDVDNTSDQIACAPLHEDTPCGAEAEAPSVETDWGACDVDGEPGECMDTEECGGTPTPGHCPGPAHIQCCI